MHEALTVLQEALRLAKPNQYDEELQHETRRLRCELCLEMSELLLKMGRPQQARSFVE